MKDDIVTINLHESLVQTRDELIRLINEDCDKMDRSGENWKMQTTDFIARLEVDRLEKKVRRLRLAVIALVSLEIGEIISRAVS